MLPPRSILLVALFVAPAPACGLHGSGDLIDVEFDHRGFKEIEGSHGVELDIEYAETYGVVVTIDDNLDDDLAVTKHGSQLSIGIDHGRPVMPTAFEADVTLPDLDAIELSGGSKAHVAGFAVLDGLRLSGSGGSRVTAASGQTVLGTLDIDGSGGSVFDLGTTITTDAVVDLSGGSRATIHVTPGGSIAANLSGGSQLFYCGTEVHVSQQLSGGSRLEQRLDC